MSSQDQPYQVMPELDSETFERLKEDIRDHGIEYPIIENADGEIIDGHHRVRAWEELGRDPDDIPRRVIEDDELENLHRAYRANLLRRDLSDGTKRRVVKQYLYQHWEGERNQSELAGDLGVSRGTIQNAIDDDTTGRLAKLSKSVKQKEPNTPKDGNTRETVVEYLKANSNESNREVAASVDADVSHDTVRRWRKAIEDDSGPKVDTFANDGRQAEKAKEVAKRARDGDPTAVEEADRLTNNQTTPEKAHRKVTKESNKREREQKRESQKERISQPDIPDDAPRPTLKVADAADLPIPDESVDLIITSPPYNLGHDDWWMGGEERIQREKGIGYQDERPEEEYQEWQLEVFRELYRVAVEGASFFYNHKVRQRKGGMIHPMDWLRSGDNPWTVRQEIVWDRKSTHNHSPKLFWPRDERIYWLTKGDPSIADGNVGVPSVWRFHGPYPDTDHPAPFPNELPRRCIEAVASDGDVILDPFGGSMTTCEVAAKLGYESIGVDISEQYVEKARSRFQRRDEGS